MYPSLAGEDEDRARSPAVALALVEREGSAAPRPAPGVFLVRPGPRVKERPDVQTECRSVPDLLDRIVSHYLRYPLRGSKARRFAGSWRSVG